MEPYQFQILAGLEFVVVPSRSSEDESSLLFEGL